MSDIRSFFEASSSRRKHLNGDGQGKSEVKQKRNRPRPLFSDSSDEEDLAKNSPKSKRITGVDRKQLHPISDSDEDFTTSKRHKQKPADPSSKTNKRVAVDPKDFFASTSLPPIERKSNKNNGKGTSRPAHPDESKKRKKSDVEFHDDPDFTAMLLEMDDDDFLKPSPSKKQRSCTDEKEAKISTTQPSELERRKNDKTKIVVKSGSPPPSKPEALMENHEKATAKVEKSPQLANKQLMKRISQEIEKPSIPKKLLLDQKVVEAADPSLLLVDKYKPLNTRTIIGQQGDKSCMKKLTSWLEHWSEHHGSGAGKPPPRPPPWHASRDDGAWAKAALLSGHPGVGKTTTAYLVAKELGYEVTEFNASDTRSKKQLDLVVADALTTRWVTNTSAKKILLMDEVDGMAGNEDRGGVAELIQLLKTSKIPVICMCNDRNHQKIRNLANHCFDLRFQKPRAEQIKAAMMSICFKEKIKITPDALSELIVGCNQDIRQILHQLTMLKARSSDAKLTADEAKGEVDKSQKTSIKLGPWDVCRKVFSATDHKSMSLMDKSDLFFHDYSLAPLFVQENYLSVTPHAAGKDKKKTMVLVSKACDSFCDGDLVERTIRSRNSWSLLPVQAMFSSVMPGEYMSGHLTGQIQFPNWLGKNSKRSKFDRMLQEVQVHTRLSANLNKAAVNRDFCQYLRDAVVRPMAVDGVGGVQVAVEVMNHYSLLREDFDSLIELSQWPDSPDPMKGIESKVKASFTRSYNKDVVLPYSTHLSHVTKKSKVSVEDQGLESDGGDGSGEEGDGIEHDPMIKAKTKTTAKKSEAKNSGKGRGRGKGKK